MVVHPDFEHFFHMLWYSSKIEHVVRHMGRCWMEDFQSLNPKPGKDEEEEEGEEAEEEPEGEKVTAKKSGDDDGDDDDDDEGNNADEENNHGEENEEAAGSEEERDKESEKGDGEDEDEKASSSATTATTAANRKEGLKMQAMCEKYSKVRALLFLYVCMRYICFGHQHGFNLLPAGK